MSFEWNRIHKWEENIEREVTDSVREYVLEFYGVEEITELTESQIEEVQKFRYEEVNEYSPMQWGFSNIYNEWEMENV